MRGFRRRFVGLLLVHQHRADPALTVSALRAAVAAAASSGARTFEAAALVTEADEVDLRDLAFLAEFGQTVPILLADSSGTVKDRDSD